jgi:hypothetical protein
MKKQLRIPSNPISQLLNAGVRAILISAAIELVLVFLAFGVGIGVGLAKGFIPGIVAGIVTFAVGQGLVILVIGMTLPIDKSPEESPREPSDHEALAELRKELETKNQADPTNL